MSDRLPIDRSDVGTDLELASTAHYTPPQSGFRRFAASSSEMAPSEDGSESVNTSESGSVAFRKLTIIDLFDFEQSYYWTSRLETSGLRGFDEELSIYDLLDLDAEGDDEIDDGASEVNPSTGDVLPL